MRIDKEILLDFLQKNEPLYFDDLTLEFGVKEDEEDDFSFLLRSLEESGLIVYTKKNKITTPQKVGLYSGVLSFFSDFARIDFGNEFFNIPFSQLNSALPGDTVLIKTDKRFGASVLKIIKENENFFVGVLYQNEKDIFFLPQRQKIYHRVKIPQKYLGNALVGQKVKVKLLSFEQGRGFLGKIITIYGNANDPSSNYEAILDVNNIKTEFSDEVLKNAVKSATTYFDERFFSGRLDLTELPVFTIDPSDAKDLDDAVSLEIVENIYRLGVHIADVSHFVKENSPLDKEALLRGTSVYFADKVVPMLPEELSNGVCSLNEKVRRFTLSVFMDIDSTGNVIDFSIKESVICSKKQCSYSDINHLLFDDADDLLKNSYKEVLPYIFNMQKLAEILRQRRFEKGSIDFELDEPKILLNDDGSPKEIVKRTRGISERIIEEFMLLANEVTAQYVFMQAIPFIYRIHEKPDENKLKQLFKLSRNFGYNGEEKLLQITPLAIQRFLSFFKGTEYEKLISFIALRSLAKAKYSPDCSLHFGLAKDCYCHFTSPIRRYPDLACHRIIKMLINKKEINKIKLKSFCENAAFLSSINELKAISAERAIEDMYKAWYMSEHIGEVFEGFISSVTSFGFYVELQNTVEGLVRVATLEDDYYELDEVNLKLIGNRTKKEYTIAQRVKVVCVGADISAGQIDFELFKEQYNKKQKKVK